MPPPAAAFLSGVVTHAAVARQMSREHFSVDGTLIEAWASMKSFRPKDAGLKALVSVQAERKDGGDPTALRSCKTNVSTNPSPATAGHQWRGGQWLPFASGADRSHKTNVSR